MDDQFISDVAQNFKDGIEAAKSKSYLQRRHDRIRAVRGARRSGAIRHSQFAEPKFAPIPQAVQSPLANVDPNAANGTQSQSLGDSTQPKSNNTQLASSNTSFPSFGNNTSTAFQFAPSNSGFSFTAGSPGTSINNPFSSIANGTGTPSSVTQPAGFQGSLFNIPAPATAVSSSSDTKPSGPSTTNLFGLSGNSQQGPSSNIFGQKDATSASTKDPQAISNPFVQIQTPQSKSSSSIFAQNIPASTQLSAYQTLSGEVQSPGNARQEGDSMSTTPDTSPQANAKTPPNPFGSINVPASPTPQTGSKSLFLTNSAPSATSEKAAANAIPSQGASLFDRISQPAAVNGQVSFTGEKAEVPNHGGSLFDRISKPSNQNVHTSSSSAPEVSKNIFAGFGQPTTPATSLEGTAFGKQDQSAAKSLFTTPKQDSSTPNLGKSVFASQVSKKPSVQSLGFFPQEATASTAPKTIEATPVPNVKAPGSSSSQISSASNTPSQGSDGSMKPLDSALGFPRSSPRISSEETEAQNTQWRLAALNTAIKKLCSQALPSEIPTVMSYYEERKQAIINAAGRPLTSVAGTKRRSTDNMHESSSAKVPKLAAFSSDAGKSSLQDSGAFTNGANASQQLFGQASSTKQSAQAKRNSEEDPSNKGERYAVSGAKNTRDEDSVSYPSLPSSSGSNTANILKNIVKGSESAPFETTPKPLVNGTSSADTNQRIVGTPEASKVKVPTSTMFTPQTNLFNQSVLPKPTAPPKAVTSPFKFPGPATNPSPASLAKTATQESKFELPTFGSGAPVNFMSQFRKAADATEEIEKAKRKADDFDSDEENEDEWERKDAEKQRTKKQRLEESLKGSTTKFLPGKGFTLEKNENVSTENPAIQPPRFDSSASANFMSQFRKAADATEEIEKAKRKADDFDSDEENEDEWERKDAEEQHAKKQTLDESLKGKAAKYVPGKGFVLTDVEQENEAKKDTASDERSSHRQSRDSSLSVFDQPRQPVPNGLNIFGHLSDVESGTEGSKKGDADDEDADSEGSEGSEGLDAEVEPQETSSSGGRSLFDRISNDENGNPIKDVPPAEEKKTSNIFGSLLNQYNAATPSAKSPTQPFSGFDFSKATPSNPKANLFGQFSQTVGSSNLSSTETSPGDHTWKTDSPIKFGNTSAAPSIKLTSPSPSSQSPFGGLFGSSKTDVPSPTPFGAVSAKGPEVGFGIGFGSKPAGTSLAPPSDAPANDSSRATSPGVSSMGDSLDESVEDKGNEEPQVQQEQIDLTRGPGEEDEENLFEVRAKALTYDNEKKEWVSKGVGPFRVLKHPETGKTRILMRQDPSGRIVINAALLSAIEYQYAAPKSIKMAIAADNGKLISYMVRVGKEQDAKDLAEILQGNKNN